MLSVENRGIRKIKGKEYIALMIVSDNASVTIISPFGTVTRHRFRDLDKFVYIMTKLPKGVPGHSSGEIVVSNGDGDSTTIEVE